MAVRSKVKSSTKSKPATKSTAKSKGAVKKTKVVQKTSAGVKKKAVKTTAAKPVVKKEMLVEKSALGKPTDASRPVAHVIKRTAAVERRRATATASLRSSQFSFMKAPISEHAFEVGDSVEVFCDHEKSRERVRGWIRGIVVQVDNKMVAVQFRSNVFLTDGWMVPDRILWYPLASEHIRPVGGKKAPLKKDFIPDY